MDHPTNREGVVGGYLVLIIFIIVVFVIIIVTILQRMAE